MLRHDSVPGSSPSHSSTFFISVCPHCPCPMIIKKARSVWPLKKSCCVWNLSGGIVCCCTELSLVVTLTSTIALIEGSSIHCHMWLFIWPGTDAAAQTGHSESSVQWQHLKNGPWNNCLSSDFLFPPHSMFLTGLFWISDESNNLLLAPVWLLGGPCCDPRDRTDWKRNRKVMGLNRERGMFKFSDRITQRQALDLSNSRVSLIWFLFLDDALK